MKQNLEKINVFLSKEIAFNGKIISEGIFRLDGKMEGEIFHSGTLIIGETAVTKGRLEVDVLILNGKLEGEVNAKVRLEIHSTGKLYGTISTPALAIQEGGFFDGNCRMVTKSDHEGNLESTEIPPEKSTEMLGDQ
jgi:cytoskeletal protein CcmA (bactofilin family)